MDNKKLVSVRIDTDVLDFIDARCAKDCGISRSEVINCALRMAVEYEKMNFKWLGRTFVKGRGDRVTRFDVEIEKGSWKPRICQPII